MGENKDEPMEACPQLVACRSSAVPEESKDEKHEFTRVLAGRPQFLKKMSQSDKGELKTLLLSINTIFSQYKK